MTDAKAWRPGPLAILLYRLSHGLWTRGFHTLAEVLWRLNFFLSGEDVHPGAQIGGGLRLTHTTGVVAKDLPDGTIYTPGRKVSELSRRIDRLEAELAALRRLVTESEAAR